MQEAKKILDFIHFSEKLKNELRNGRTSEDKKESVAEHSWRVALILILTAPYLDKDIDLKKALKMAVLHDIAEAITGDAPYFAHEFSSKAQEKKRKNELSAINEIKSMLPEPLGSEMFDLWKDYEEANSYEARLVKALDKMEAQIQHNEMNFKHWNEHDLKHAPSRLDKYCKIDSFLVKLKNLIQKESAEKISKK